MTAEYINKERVVRYLYNQAEALDESGGSFMAAVYAQGWADAIKNWPSADVAPMVHAHWDCPDSEWDDNWRCSGCGVRLCTPGYVALVADKWKYCPHCGAKMDEEDGK